MSRAVSSMVEVRFLEAGGFVLAKPMQIECQYGTGPILRIFAARLA